MSTALMINSKQKSVNVEVSPNVQSLASKNISFFEEVKKYLDIYPNTRQIDICLYDINGHIRGKRIDVNCLNNLSEGCYFHYPFMQ